MTKRLTPIGVGKSASLAEARRLGASTTMTELTQAELAKELGFWPATAKGWTWAWQTVWPLRLPKVPDALNQS